MKLIIILMLLVIIICSVYYNLVIKYKNVKESFFVENFNNNDLINNDELNKLLIKYSSINLTLKTLKDVIDLQEFILYLKESNLDVSVIDTYIIDDNDIMNKIDDYLRLKVLNIKNNKINDDIYIIIYKNFELNNNDKKKNEIDIYNNMTYVKIILIYGYNKNIFNKYFQKNNYDNKTIVYKLNKSYKPFNHYHLQ